MDAIFLKPFWLDADPIANMGEKDVSIKWQSRGVKTKNNLLLYTILALERFNIGFTC